MKKASSVKRKKYQSKKDSENLSSKWKAISFGGKLFLVSPVLMLLVYKILDDTINTRYFILFYGSVGMLVYFILTCLLKNKTSLVFDKWGYPASFLISISVFTVLNYVLLNSSVKVKMIAIREKHISSSYRSKSYWIFFMNKERLQRFTVDKELWGSMNEGTIVKMYYQESAFGFNIVSKFEK